MPRRTRALPALASPFSRRSRAALVRRAGQAGIARHRPPVAQVARQDLVHQHVGGLDANPDDPRQQPHHRMAALLGLLLKPLRTRGLDLLDLVHDKAQPRHVAPQLGQGVRRQRRAFRRAQVLETLRRPCAGSA